MSEAEKIQLQEFQNKLNQEPSPESLDKTPDGKAQTVTISFIEMTLDELYLGQWSTRNFKTRNIANEVVGEIELEVINPISGMSIVRTGSAAIQIQVDKVPDAIKDSPQEKNRWHLNSDNKKPNALDLGYPKLKAECLKNAAQSLGKIFGRDLNRKKADTYRPSINVMPEKAFLALLERNKNGEFAVLERATVHFILTDEQRERLDQLKQKQLNAAG